MSAIIIFPFVIFIFSDFLQLLSCVPFLRLLFAAFVAFNYKAKLKKKKCRFIWRTLLRVQVLTFLIVGTDLLPPSHHLILKKGLPHICAHVPRVTLNVKQTKGSSVSCIKAFILPINFSIRFLPFLPLVFYSHPLKWKVDEHEKSPNALSITRWHSPVHFHAPISALKGTLDVEIQKKTRKTFLLFWGWPNICS